MKILLSLLLLALSIFASTPKATGCELSQVGDVKLILGKKMFAKTTYHPIQKTGNNFKAIFIGSTISTDDTTLKIIDIQANKRVKKQPRTGTITIELQQKNNKETIKMRYTYNKGDFYAEGSEKNGEKIIFALKIKAILCHSK